MAAVLGAFACALGSAAGADELPPEAAAAATVQTPLDQGIALRQTGPIGKVVVSQPETIEVRASGSGIYVIGRERGAANLLVYDPAGRLSQSIDVQVAYDARGLRESLAAVLPDEPITVTALASGLVLDGEVSSPAAADIALRLAQQAAPEAATSRLRIRGGQISLEVRIFETGSRRLRDIGAALALSDGAHVAIAAGSGLVGPEQPQGLAALRLTPGRYQLDATLQALETRGEVQMLAQPTLVTLSGEPASFRAGGEVPYPVPDGDRGNLKLEFKPYGTTMAVQPDVQPNGLIRLRLEAERSELDPAVGLRIGGFVVPGLLTRRATTTVDLHDGESYLVAGLFEDGQRAAELGAPLVSRAPLIGPLLKALQRQQDRRELAIVVTARIVRDDETPAEAAPSPSRTRTPKAVSAPRGPPLTELKREAKQVLGPPVRWVKRQVLGVLTALRLRR